MFYTQTGRQAEFTTKLRPEEQEIIKAAFRSFKQKGKDVITTQSMREAFEKIDPGLKQSKDAKRKNNEEEDVVQHLIDDIDENGDGEVDEDEFTAIMTKKFLGQDDDGAFIHTFECIDKDKDGFIPTVEMRHILMTEGREPLSEQEVDELMMFADSDGDGLVDYRAFLRWLSNPEKGVQRT